METVLEIIKYTLPALIVFATSYYLLRQYLNNQYNMKALEMRSKYSQDAIPLKLQAYERLLLFCERINLHNLILRLKTSNMTNLELKNAMIISIQKEYEHNMAQQLYASQKLWDIITLAKNDTISIIGQCSANLNNNMNADGLAAALMAYNQKQEKSPLNLAVSAIKEEAKIILNV